MQERRSVAMNFKQLYIMQSKLDDHILENNFKRTGEKIWKVELLEKTTLALLVEIAELANATRCFKHWSTKGAMGSQVILDELADVWHFYLSIGNQSGVNYNNEKDIKLFMSGKELTNILLDLYEDIIFLSGSTAFWTPEYINNYIKTGQRLMLLNKELGFTNGEVEEAYNKKHEENYKRQANGY
jgi:dimeric dUTPase (all-alpha-NTP-PPase superfamily)